MQGKSDLMYGTNPNIGKRTEGGIQATGKYLSNHMVLVMGTNPEGNRVALQRGRTLSAEIAESMAHDSITVDCDTAKACLDAVLAGKADRACIDGYVASYLVSESQYRSLAVATIGESTNDLSIGEISRSTVAFYSSSMKEREVRERELASLARNALEQGEFTAYYQPKVDIATGRIVGFEALARWNSPEFGLMSPAEFIPLLERNGMVVELDLHLFDLACKRIRDCLDKTGQAPFIACNFSRRHPSTNDFPCTLKRIAQWHETPISHLELELTESIVIDNPQHARSVCRQLKQLGFRISIDDFGSGYSSLGTLHDIPFDVLKLDRSLLLSAQDSISGWAILESTVKIATHLNARVVVEGVETPEQADMLLKLDCNVVAQGYLHSRPVAREESDAQFDAGRLEPCAHPAPDTGR